MYAHKSHLILRPSLTPPPTTLPYPGTPLIKHFAINVANQALKHFAASSLHTVALGNLQKCRTASPIDARTSLRLPQHNAQSGTAIL